ncbi:MULTISPECIES: hypothetical protein [Pseudomonas]|uniref:Uncharacterized protein n=1 Tax=Pseudomonas fluorescens TaxID=294 RepID=A0A0N9W0G1_PSEFL|nr:MULTISPECIES: hypothetical protein [Pseudomonas]ALI06601.1 hypothetical protein AO356_07225 [Pseudomonas fluorescens]POA10452.1 hypothetical protein C1892_31415 [Pseudomonas sp. MPBD7-1]
MAAEEIRISLKDFDKDESPEVRLEFFRDNKSYLLTFVASSLKDGRYDKVGIKTDLNEDGACDERDIELLTQLAQAAVPLLK